MHNQLSRSVLYICLTALLGPAIGFGQASSLDDCSTGAALLESKSEFMRLRELRERNPNSVSEADFRSAASDYVARAEGCYVELNGSLGADLLIDDGGLWFDDDSDGSARFVTFGTKWGAGSPFGGGQDITGPGLSGGEVTYSFMADGVDISAEQAPLYNTSITSLATFNACFLTELEDAFAAWSAIASISFIMVADDGLPFDTGSAGNIRIGSHYIDGPSGALAHAYYPPPNGATAAGDLHFDQDEIWACEDTGPNLDIGIVALHEIGHAIGLGHQSFPPTALMNAFYNPAIGLLQPDDVIGADSIYGSSQVNCNVDTTQSSYSGNEQVTLSTFAINNPGASPMAVELKIWLDSPFMNPNSILNVGADGSSVLPALFVAEYGPAPFFVASDAAPAIYELGCRLLDPITGLLLNESINTFEILP